MGALIQAIWYALVIVLRIAFWPAVIIGGVALIARLAGAANRAAKKKEQENEKK